MFTANNKIVPFKGAELDTDHLIAWAKKSVSIPFISQMDLQLYWGNKFGKSWRNIKYWVGGKIKKRKITFEDRHDRNNI